MSRDKFEIRIARGGYRDLGDLSAVEPPYRIRMQCDRCRIVWYGCWDQFQCPECGEGELPTQELGLQA
jgi:hypothetical protein